MLIKINNLRKDFENITTVNLIKLQKTLFIK